MTTFGSLGDLHPYIAIALEMKRRNVEPVIVTSEIYRSRIEPLGIEFRAMRPELPALDSPEATEIIDRIFDPRRGAEFLFKDLLAPAVLDSYLDLKKAIDGADLLITHPVTIAGPLVAQTTGIRWVSTVLAPASLWSDHAPIVPANAPLLYMLMRYGGRGVTAFVKKLVDGMTRSWLKPVDELREELGLPKGANPIFAGQFSPELNLGLFSDAIYERPPDIPSNTVITGFPFYDGVDQGPLTMELQHFLTRGPAPIVFTLGSSAVHVAGDFFRESIEAARIAGRRAVFLVGSEKNLPREPLPDGMIAATYAPYGELLPRASMVVHQGGVGTTAQALRAGVPTLVMPFSHDQPDNAARVERLGVSRTIERKRYKAGNVAREIRELLGRPAYRLRAIRVGERIGAENGTAWAVESILTLIREKENKGVRAAAVSV